MSSKCDKCDTGDRDESCDATPVKPDILMPAQQINTESHLLYDDSRNLTINILNKYKIYIYKPLIPLKLSLFLVFGGGSFMLPFLTLLYKQRGITLSQMSVISMVTPVFQILGTTFSGVVADKLGRPKLILLANHLLLLSAVIGILIMPGIDNAAKALLECHLNGSSTLRGSSGKDIIQVHSCHRHCAGELTIPSDMARLNDTSLPRTSDTYLPRTNGTHQNNIVSVDVWCSRDTSDDRCAISCSTEPDLVAGWKLCTYSVLFVLLLTTYTIGFRFHDVACMALVEAHGSTFGRERVFAMIGEVLVSPLAGLLADVSAPIGSKRNFLAPLYLYLGINLLLVPVLCILPIINRTPSRQMWRDTTRFVKRLDTLTFLGVVLVIGTVWNFKTLFLYWHLESLGSSSLLMGLVSSTSALYSLPILFISHWWIEKAGSSVVFVAALLAYAVNTTGYALLHYPWVSLGLEVTNTVSYFLLWVAVVQHSHQIAPPGLTTTVISTAGAIHFSGAKVTAGLLGRFIMDSFGSRAAFGFCAMLSVTTAFLYAVYLCSKNKSHHSEKSVGNVDCQVSPALVPKTAVDEANSTEIPNQRLQYPKTKDLASQETLNIYQQTNVHDQYFLDHCKGGLIRDCE